MKSFLVLGILLYPLVAIISAETCAEFTISQNARTLSTDTVKLTFRARIFSECAQEKLKRVTVSVWHDRPPHQTICHIIPKGDLSCNEGSNCTCDKEGNFSVRKQIDKAEAWHLQGELSNKFTFEKHVYVWLNPSQVNASLSEIDRLITTDDFERRSTSAVKDDINLRPSVIGDSHSAVGVKTDSAPQRATTFPVVAPTPGDLKTPATSTFTSGPGGSPASAAQDSFSVIGPIGGAVSIALVAVFLLWQVLRKFQRRKENFQDRERDPKPEASNIAISSISKTGAHPGYESSVSLGRKTDEYIESHVYQEIADPDEYVDIIEDHLLPKLDRLTFSEPSQNSYLTPVHATDPEKHRGRRGLI